MKDVEPYDFESMGSLKGKTLLITGASRGIGLAIGVKAAKDGANVAILAKTVTENPKLPGTIYTAAKAIEEAGGKALSIVCDCRDEKQIEDAVKKTVETFGGIDILVNNVSALYNTPVEDTAVKRYDLAMTLNVRATFVASKFCIPHLRKSKNPHILTISPPMYAVHDPRNWYAKMGTGYVTAKCAMTLVTFGISGEVKEDGIAANTLWPRTAIQTAAVKNLLGGSESMDRSRKESIMAESAYVILTSNSRKTTGNFFLDDHVLASVGK